MGTFTITNQELINAVGSPTVDNNNLNLNFATTFEGMQTENFLPSSFVNNFIDPDSDNPLKVRINSLPAIGQLLYNGSPINVGFEFNVIDSNLLSYTIDNVKSEIDGVYTYPFDLTAEMATLIAQDFELTNYSNGVYTYSKLSGDLTDTGVDGTFNTLPEGFSNVNQAGWQNGTGTMDTITPGSTGTGSRFGRNVPPSEEGGNVVGSITRFNIGQAGFPAPDYYIETMFTDLAVEAGKTYRISFEQTHAGDTAFPSGSTKGVEVGDAASWTISLDGIRVLSKPMPFEGQGNQSWERVFVDITVPTTKSNARLEVWAGKTDSTDLNIENDLRSYLLMDDLKIQEILNSSTDTQQLIGSSVTGETFEFQTSDDSIQELFSPIATMTLGTIEE